MIVAETSFTVLVDYRLALSCYTRLPSFHCDWSEDFIMGCRAVINVIRNCTELSSCIVNWFIVFRILNIPFSVEFCVNLENPLILFHVCWKNYLVLFWKLSFWTFTAQISTKISTKWSPHCLSFLLEERANSAVSQWSPWMFMAFYFYFCFLNFT